MEGPGLETRPEVAVPSAPGWRHPHTLSAVVRRSCGAENLQFVSGSHDRTADGGR